MQTHTFEASSHLSEINALSAVNIAHIKEGYISSALELGQFNSREETEAAIGQREEAAQKDFHLTINMTASSLNHFLHIGRMECHWDAFAATSGQQQATRGVNNKAVHDEYDQMRSAADAGFQKYAPVDASRQDPIYAAVATDSDKRGAAPMYGNYWVVVSDTFADRAVYGFSDSHASLSKNEDGNFIHDNSSILNRSDAVTAKAVTELTAEYTKSLNLRMLTGSIAIGLPGETMPKLLTINGRAPGYVEAAIFDQVELEDAFEIHGVMTDRQSMHDTGVLIRTNQYFAERALIEDATTTSELVSDWFAYRRNKGENAPEASELWQRFGIALSSDSTTMAKELKQTASILLRDISKITHKPRDLQLVDFKSNDRWHNYIRNVRCTGQYLRPAVQPKLQQLLAEFIEVQEARVFFNDDIELPRR